MELMLAYILIIFPIILVFYVAFIYWYATMPSVIQFARYRERRYARGYDGNSIIMLSVLFIISIALFVWYIFELLKNNYLSNSKIFNYIFSPLSFLVVCTICIYFLYHKYSVNIFKLSFKKNTKNEDLLEPRKINSPNNPQNIILHNYLNNFNTFNTEVSVDNSTSETHVDNSVTNNNVQQSEKLLHPLLKNLTREQLTSVINSFNDLIIIDEISLAKLYHLFEGKDIEGRVQITVINQKNKLNYRRGIDFIKKIVDTENVVNPLTEKEFYKTEIAHIVEKYFWLKSSLGDEKTSIAVVDLYYEKFRF